MNDKRARKLVVIALICILFTVLILPTFSKNIDQLLPEDSLTESDMDTVKSTNSEASEAASGNEKFKDYNLEDKNVIYGDGIFDIAHWLEPCPDEDGLYNVFLLLERNDQTEEETSACVREDDEPGMYSVDMNVDIEEDEEAEDNIADDQQYLIDISEEFTSPFEIIPESVDEGLAIELDTKRMRLQYETSGMEETMITYQIQLSQEWLGEESENTILEENPLLHEAWLAYGAAEDEDIIVQEIPEIELYLNAEDGDLDIVQPVPGEQLLVEYAALHRSGPLISHGSIQIKSGIKDVAATEEFSFHLSGPLSTGFFLQSGNQKQLTPLPWGSYQLRPTIPSGYQLADVIVDGTSQGSRQEINIILSETQLQHTIEYVFAKKEKARFFTSNDKAENQFRSSVWRTQKKYDVAITGSPLPANPESFDVVLLVDLSASMDKDMMGNNSPPAGSSRLDILRVAVKDFVNTLTEEPAAGSRLMIVTFNGFRTNNYTGEPVIVQLDWTELEQINSNAVSQNIDLWTAEKTTQPDLAFARLREIFQQDNSTNQRYVVFFTDGAPGSAFLPKDDSTADANGTIFFPSYAGKYETNNFRVMAETINQAKLLRGARNQTISVNTSVKGYNRPRYAEISYYGVSAGGSSAAAQATRWKNTDNWQITQVFNRPQASTFSTVAAGNYTRTDVGCGVTIYSIGLFDATTYWGEASRHIDNYMAQVSDLYAVVQEKDEFLELFERLSRKIAGYYSDTVIQYYIDENYTVLDSGGGELKQDDQGKQYIEWSAMTISREQPLDLTVKLESVTAEQVEPPQHQLLIGTIVNGQLMLIDENTIVRQVVYHDR